MSIALIEESRSAPSKSRFKSLHRPLRARKRKSKPKPSPRKLGLPPEWWARQPKAIMALEGARHEQREQEEAQRQASRQGVSHGCGEAGHRTGLHTQAGGDQPGRACQHLAVLDEDLRQAEAAGGRDGRVAAAAGEGAGKAEPAAGD